MKSDSVKKFTLKATAAAIGVGVPVAVGEVYLASEIINVAYASDDIQWTVKNGNVNISLDNGGVLTVEPIVGTNGTLGGVFRINELLMKQEKVTKKKTLRKIVVKNGVIANKSLKGAFSWSKTMADKWGELEEVDLRGLNTKNTRDMSYLFSEANVYKITLGGSFTTENVENMVGMFSKTTASEIDLGDTFITKKVRDMSSMFENMSNITYLDLGKNFDTTNVKNMNSMFAGTNLTSLDLGENFVTSSVRDMGSMFENANLKSLNLGEKFDTTNVKNMQSMFQNSKLKTLDLGSRFNTKQVNNMSSMFENMEDLVRLDMPASFIISKKTKTTSMFDNTSPLRISVGERKTTMRNLFDIIPKMSKEQERQVEELQKTARAKSIEKIQKMLLEDEDSLDEEDNRGEQDDADQDDENNLIQQEKNAGQNNKNSFAQQGENEESTVEQSSELGKGSLVGSPADSAVPNVAKSQKQSDKIAKESIAATSAVETNNNVLYGSVVAGISLLLLLHRKSSQKI